MKRWLRCTLALGLLALTAAQAVGQTGTLRGTVVDEATGTILPGVDVTPIGTLFVATSDGEGVYALTGMPAGTYTLRFSLGGYGIILMEDVVINPDAVTELAVQLKADAPIYSIQGFSVSAERPKTSSSAVLTKRQRSTVIGDGISAEQIAQSADVTSGDALKRVTGLSLVDDKFIFVRGVTDRYNTSSIDGLAVTSTDTKTDKKSFSFDILPAGLLANTVVVKTATPDLPGNFAGGAIQMNTTEFPSSRRLSFSASSGYNAEVDRNHMYSTLGGGADWLGRDDGSRDLPRGLSLNELAQALPNNWSVGPVSAKHPPLNGSYNLSYGDRFRLGDQELGLLGSLSYKTGYSQSSDVYFSSQTRSQYISWLDSTITWNDVEFNWRGKRYTTSVFWGGLLNLNYRLSPNHKLMVRNTFSQNADESVALFSGEEWEYEQRQSKQSIEWNERMNRLHQISGKHRLAALGGLDAQWRLGFGHSTADQPDRKEVTYDLEDPTQPKLNLGMRTWQELAEDTREVGFDFGFPYAGANVKTGLARNTRERGFFSRAFASIAEGLTPEHQSLPLLPIDVIFSPENYGPGKLVFTPWSDTTGEYAAKETVASTYLMAELPITLPVLGGRAAQLTGGVRLEETDTEVDTKFSLIDDTVVGARIDQRDVLPSANLNCLLAADINVRLAYSQSLNRPEFRELSPVRYYDFSMGRNVVGNPELAIAEIENYDLRLEYFPSPGEVFAFSLFYKDITNAIEEDLTPTPGSAYQQSWQNAPKGKNFGMELEVRKSLAMLRELSGYFRNFAVSANYMRVQTEIDDFSAFNTMVMSTQGEDSLVTRLLPVKRPMQGQAPWILNLGLSFREPHTGANLSLLYNKMGRSLDFVDNNDVRELDIYRAPRDLVDLALSQNLAGRYKVKLSVKNLAGKDEELTRGSEERHFMTRTRGPQYTLALGMDI